VALQIMGLNLGDTASADYAVTMLITVGVTTVVWLAVTLLTPPESEATLERFYRRVRPGGAGWRPVSERLGYGQEPIPGGALSWVNWIAGVIAVYAAVFAVGAILTGWPGRGAFYGVVSVTAFSLIYRNLRADPTLETSVDRVDSATLGLMPDRTGS
jgi:SSS family solute:Na+ symporter